MEIKETWEIQRLHNWDNVKKWVAVDDMVKELQKYHNGLHPECNICKLIKKLKYQK